MTSSTNNAAVAGDVRGAAEHGISGDYIKEGKQSLRAAPSREPLATIKAYRRKGGAVVTIERAGRPKHRHCVSLRRYHALREWTHTRPKPRYTSGAWLRSGMTVYLWGPSQP